MTATTTTEEPVVDEKDAMAAHEALLALASPAPSLDGAPKLPDLVKGRFITVDVLALDPHPDTNPREHLTGIQDLAENIRQFGLYQVPRVRKRGRKLELVDGRRRHAALKWLAQNGHPEWRYVAAELESRKEFDDLDALATGLFTSWHKSGLDPIEEARAIRSLMRGWKLATAEEAAERFGGVSSSTIRHRLMLLDNLSTAEQEQVRARTMSLGDALARAKTRKAAETPPKQRTEGVAVPARPRTVEPAPSVFWFGPGHRLEGPVRIFCANRPDHRPKVKVGGVACGECWETVIIEETRRKVIDELSQEKGAVGAAARKMRVDHRINQAREALGG